MTNKLDLDPRIDLTKPIYQQRVNLDASDHAPPGHAPSEAHHAPSSLRSGYERLQAGLAYIEKLRAEPTWEGSIRVELEFSGIRVWYRRNELRRSHALSWQVLETGINNQLILAIDEVIRSAAFAESPAGKRARSAQMHRTKSD